MTEKEGEPEGTNYIGVYDKIENLILRNITVLKNQKEPNGSLLYFGKYGKADNLILNEVHTKGLKSEISYCD